MLHSLPQRLCWIIFAIFAAYALSIVAFSRGEPVNAAWMIAASSSIYLIAYRYYSLFLAKRVVKLNPKRLTPAWKHNDGLDFVPTNRFVLFGHHFAAIAGAGPLVGPVLAAQMGYLPGTLWILFGVVFAGAVQDFMILFLSTRRDGRSLGELIKIELGVVPGVIALFGVFMIMIILLAVLALVVVKALSASPWGMFTVAMTIPIAMLMGLYVRYLRPGRICEVSLLGFVLLIAAIFSGQFIQAHPYWSTLFHFESKEIVWMLIIYGFTASALPVWLLLAPRDYLSTFLKIGAILAFAFGILIVQPELKMPAFTAFADGNGPVWSGKLFPFLFITIACGAISGFHALISSGTTPKLVENESHIRFIGYGGMLMESFVAIMAMIAAAIIDPGIYFAMNSPAALIGTSAATAAEMVSQWGFPLSEQLLLQTAQDVGEHSLLSRTGGAPTFAIGMATLFSEWLGGQKMMAFWYHFAILFESLFILTAVDAGTRAARFMLQDLLGIFSSKLKKTESTAANMLATALCTATWGYFLYQGVIDPYGGVNTLWPLFGIANQMLAAIALILATVVLFKMKRKRYAAVSLLPTIFLLGCTGTAAWQKVFHSDASIGFLAQAQRLQLAVQEQNIILPYESLQQMQQMIWNNYINAGLTLLFSAVMLSIAVYGFLAIKHTYLQQPIANKTSLYTT